MTAYVQGGPTNLAQFFLNALTLFPVVTFLKCIVAEVVLFSIVAFKTLTFHKVV